MSFNTVNGKYYCNTIAKKDVSEVEYMFQYRKW